MTTENKRKTDLEYHIQLVIQSRLSAVPLLAGLVGAICDSAGLCPSDRHLVGLCLVEAANNVIIHAYHEEPGKNVRVEVTLCPEKIWFDVIDSGRPADPAKMNADHRAALEPGSSQDSLAESGRGIAIMQEVMDSVEYTVQPGSNRLRLTKHFEKVTKSDM